MSTKMKGILKGLRFIYQVFEEKKEHREIQIGLPTDVKHVAHIGWEGASVDQPPSWMKEFNEDPTDLSLDTNGTQAGGASQKVSRDSSPKSMRKKERSMTPTSTSDSSQVLKSSTSSKQRRPKKQMSKGASKNSPSKQPTRKPKNSTEPTEEGSVKKVRQKKAKNSENGCSNRHLKADNVTASPPS